MGPTEVIQNLKVKSTRQNSVLVLNGLGVNFWHYQPFLRHFSLEELNDFAAIYGISGASGGFWFHLIDQENGLNKNLMKDLDPLLRSTLNSQPLFKRIYSLFKNDYLYDASDLIKFITNFIAPSYTSQLFESLPINNFVAVAHEDQKNELLLFDKKSSPKLPVLKTLCNAGFPRKVKNRYICKGLRVNQYSISDIEFSGQDIKRLFKTHLAVTHKNHTLYQLNIFRSEDRGHTKYVRVCGDSFPLLGQLTDLLLAFFNIPNPRPYRTYSRILSANPTDQKQKII